MELKTENKKAKNIILGIISCIVIAMLVWGIIAVSSKKDSEESGRESIKTTGQTKASKEDLTLNTGNIGEGELSTSEEKTEGNETDTTKEEAATDITSGEKIGRAHV